MSIHVHKTGLNKTLGQKSASIVTTNLVGNWDPSTGIETAYWDNQVSSGNNLRRFNSIAKSNSGNCHYWAFDGTDDYLGPASSGYGGSAFQVVLTSAFSLSQWVKWDTGKEHNLFGFNNGLSWVFRVEIGVTTANKLTIDSNPNLGDPIAIDYTFTDDTWHYVTVTYDGSDDFLVYVNGSFVGGGSITEAPWGTADMYIGRYDSNYTDSTIRVGKVHVYNAQLKNSQVRQNFLASHVINNTRVYGATYTA